MFPIRSRACAAAIALAFPLAVSAGSAPVTAEKKGMLVYAYGSDWSESGRRVLGAFQSPAFASAFTNRYVFGVLDDADAVTDEIKLANRRAERGDLGSFRLPALFASDADGRGFLVAENLPITTTPDELAQKLAAAEKDHAHALRLLAEANRLKGVAAAEKRGAAMELFARGVGDGRVTGKKCLNAEFERLKREDPEDRTGWQRRFTIGNCTALVKEANAFRETKNFDGGRDFLRKERAKSAAHLTLNQRQGVELLPYALDRFDPAKRAENVKLLDRVAAMGPDTLWGRAAVGFLIREKAPEAEKYRTKQPPRDVLRPRAQTNGVAAADALAKTLRDDLALLQPLSPDDLAGALPERTRTALVRAFILTGAGTNALAGICGREGGAEFLRRFLADRVWMEGFSGSGPWHFGGDAALLTLDTLVWNVPEAETDPMLRRAATAFSMNFKASEHDAKTVETLRIFRDLAKAGRLHDRAKDLDVYGWRYLLFPWDRDKPEDLLALNAFANCSYKRLFAQCWKVPYRMRNCFGESVFGKWYYQPWAHTDTRYTVAPEIGGVCNMISSFGTTLGHSHGLMAVTAGQPGHCAFLVRPEKGGKERWQKHYHIAPYTRGKWTIFRDRGGYHNILLGEDLYECSDLAAREFPRWLAAVRRELAETLYRRAMENVPGNLHAALEWANLLMTTHPKDVARWEDLGEAVLKTMPNRIPANVQILEKMFGAMAAAGRGERRIAWAKRLLESIREEEGAKFEPPDFCYVLDALDRTFKKSPDDLFAIHLKALETQRANKDFLAQIIGRGMSRYAGKPRYEAQFVEACAASVVASGVRDVALWRKQIKDAEGRDNPDAVACLRRMAARFFPPPALRPGAKPYPESDFGGELVTGRSIVKMSRKGKGDGSERHDELFDVSPLRDAKAGAPAVASRGNGGDLWIGHRLGGNTDVTGIRIVGPRRFPDLVAEASEDGKAWRTLGEIKSAANEVRLEVTQLAKRVRFVRVRVVNPGKRDTLAIEKFLVYGKRLY